MASKKLHHIVETDLAADYYETTGTSFTSSGAASGFPADLAGNRTRSNYWKASGTSNVWLKAQLGPTSSNIFNVICIGNHNLNAGGWSGIVFEESDDNAVWDTTYTWTGATPGGFSSDSEYGTPLRERDFAILFGASRITKFVRLSITSATSAPQVGIFTVGRAFAYQEPAPGLMRETMTFPRAEVITEGSGKVVELHDANRILWRFEHGVRTLPRTVGGAEDVRDLYDTIANLKGPGRPFWYIPRDDDGGVSSTRESRAYWSWLEGDFSLVEKFTNLYDYDFNTEEVR